MTMIRRGVPAWLLLAAMFGGLLFLRAYLNPTPTDASCTQAYIDLYQDVGHSGSNKLRVCYPTHVDLQTVGHAPAGLCPSSNFWEPDDWNDCVSSITYNEITVDTAVCLWENGSNPIGDDVLKVVGDGSWDFTGGLGYMNDITTWVEWGNNCLASGIGNGLP